jgi:hypothetical protein
MEHGRAWRGEVVEGGVDGGSTEKRDWATTEVAPVNEAAWAELAVFESSDLIKRFYHRRHHLELNSTKAREITTALVQGRQYFNEVRSAGDLARPLLLFYGVVALTRALILFLQPTAKEENLSQSHGLNAQGWQQTLASGIRHVPDLQIEVTGGTFSELANATKRTDRTQVYKAPYPSTVTVTKVENDPMDVGWSFTVRELLARIPDLHNLYEEAFDEFAACRMTLVFLLLGLGPYQTSFTVPRTRRGLVPEDRVRQDLQLGAENLMHSANDNFLGNVENWHVQQPRDSEQALLDHLPDLMNDAAENTFVIPRMANAPKLSRLLMLYALSYATGMLARYYPSKWVTLLTGGPGDFSYPLLAAGIRLVEDVFPSMALAEISAGN